MSELQNYFLIGIFLFLLLIIFILILLLKATQKDLIETESLLIKWQQFYKELRQDFEKFKKNLLK